MWQSKRAVDSYGEGGAKALWAVISLIDGIPMLYQGDEDPSIYLAKGPKLTDFFTRLFHDRKEYLGESDVTEYLYTKSPLMAFLRREKKDRLVLVNLSGEAQSFSTEAYPSASVLAGSCALEGASVLLPGYGYAILQI